MTTLLTITADTPVAAAVRTMREHHAQLAVVVDADGATVGVVSVENLLDEIIGEFDGETDPSSLWPAAPAAPAKP